MTRTAGIQWKLISGGRRLRALVILVATLGLAAFGSAQVTLQPDFELPGGSSYPTFGWSLDADADALIVGAPGAGNGKALVYRISTNTLIRELTVPESVAGDEFGHAVAVSGSFALVGAPGRNGGAGKVYLFDLANGQLVGGFVPGDVVPGDRFGEALDLDASLGKLLVGAPGQAGGAAYLVAVVGLVPQAKLVGAGSPVNLFGSAVGIGSETLVVGEPVQGRVHAYSSLGLPLFQLTSVFEWFASRAALAVRGSRVVIGAGDSQVPTTDGGVLYSGDGSGGGFIPSDGPAGALLGQDVELTDQLVVASAPGWAGGGRVQLYRPYNMNQETASLLPPATGPSQDFGWSIATSGDLCFVGAPGARRVLGFDLAVVSQVEPGEPFCSGDGTAAGCFCGASSLAGSGCPNSVGAAGASLLGSGNPSMSQGTFQLSASGLPPGRPSLMLRANGQLNGGLGTPVGDGLLCVTGASNRSQVQFADPGGGTTFTDFNGGSLGLSAGSALNYQLWYRDPANACSGAGFNFSNGWEVNWVP